MARILEIGNSMIDRFALRVSINRSYIHVIDSYIGEGYAKADRPVFNTIIELARNEGVITDPVYTGKAALGLKSELAKGKFKGTTIYWHTGGIFGLFPFRKSIEQFL